MRSYDSITTHVKPPPGATQLHYVDAFDSDFSLTLRERRLANLPYMMNDAIEAGVNLTTSGKMKQKLDFERKKVRDGAQPSSSHSSYDIFDNMIKTMEKIMEILVVGDRPIVTQQQDPQMKNPNFRRQQFLQIRQRNPNEIKLDLHFKKT